MGIDGSDAEMIEASWSDPSRFGDVFRRHHGAVYGYVVRTLGYPEGPDVAAKVFVEAFESRHRYDVSHPSARPWLLGIAAHLVADHYRRRERGRRATLRLGNPTTVPDFADEAARRVDADAAHGVIRGALGQLRREEAEVVSLYALAGLSYGEIAEATGVAVGTVKSRLSRARGRLRNLLGDFDENSDET
ncbi:MAG: RNA polymerase sigma factor [Actinobacteria bacterium]|nr:RNA polymerase sigma factor [Actinomycetota bacterium]